MSFIYWFLYVKPSLYSWDKPHIVMIISFKNISFGASLVTQWLGVCLLVRGTRVRALVREDPACRGAAGPSGRGCWACALEPVSRSCWARVPWLLRPARLENVLRGRGGGCCGEKPVHHGGGWPPARRGWRGLACSNEDPVQPKINK